MIDLHTHVLPGIDDGPQSIEDALALARGLVADGVTHAVLTPHVYAEHWPNTRTSLLPHFEKFKASLEALKIPLRVSLGGEVRLNDALLDLLDRDEIPTLGVYQGLRTMLLELPDATIPLGSDKLARHLIAKGYCPIIVHPERNKAVMARPEKLEPFVAMGCQVQLTAASVIGEFGRSAQQASDILLRNGWVNAIGSDCHNMVRRTPKMSQARQYLVVTMGQELARKLTHDHPAQLCGLT